MESLKLTHERLYNDQVEEIEYLEYELRKLRKKLGMSADSEDIIDLDEDEIIDLDDQENESPNVPLAKSSNYLV